MWQKPASFPCISHKNSRSRKSALTLSELESDALIFCLVPGVHTERGRRSRKQHPRTRSPRRRSANPRPPIIPRALRMAHELIPIHRGPESAQELARGIALRARCRNFSGRHDGQRTFGILRRRVRVFFHREFLHLLSHTFYAPGTPRTLPGLSLLSRSEIRRRKSTTSQAITTWGMCLSLTSACEVSSYVV